MHLFTAKIGLLNSKLNLASHEYAYVLGVYASTEDYDTSL